MAVAGNLLINISAADADFKKKIDSALRKLHAFKQKAKPGKPEPIIDLYPTISNLGKLQKVLTSNLAMFGGIGAGIAAAMFAANKAIDVVIGSLKTLGKFALLSIKKFAEFQTVQTSFKVLLGSLNDAKKLMKDLTRLSNTTPLSPGEVQEAGRKLLAFGEGARTVTSTLRMLGDVAAGTGNRIGDIAEIYGKARVQGRLFAEDINQLTGRGIPIIGELAKVLGVAEGSVKDMVSAGKVGFPELEKAFQAMTAEGGKFSGMMAEQSNTIDGIVSTIKGNLDEVLKVIGERLIKAFDIKPILKGFAEALTEITSHFTLMGDEVEGQEELIKGWRDTFLDAAEVMYDAINSLIQLMDVLTRHWQNGTEWGLKMKAAWAAVKTVAQVQINANKNNPDNENPFAGIKQRVKAKDALSGLNKSGSVPPVMQAASGMLANAIQMGINKATSMFGKRDGGASGTGKTGGVFGLTTGLQNAIHLWTANVKTLSDKGKAQFFGNKSDPTNLVPGISTAIQMGINKAKAAGGAGGAFGGVFAVGMQQAITAMTMMPKHVSESLASAMESGSQESESVITRALQGNKAEDKAAKQRAEVIKQLAALNQKVTGGRGVMPANLGGAA